MPIKYCASHIHTFIQILKGVPCLAWLPNGQGYYLAIGKRLKLIEVRVEGAPPRVKFL